MSGFFHDLWLWMLIAALFGAFCGNAVQWQVIARSRSFSATPMDGGDYMARELGYFERQAERPGAIELLFTAVNLVVDAISMPDYSVLKFARGFAAGFAAVLVCRYLLFPAQLAALTPFA